MLIPVLDIPNDADALMNRSTNQVHLSVDKITSRMIYEAQPKNKVFNSAKLDRAKINSVAEKFVTDLQSNMNVFFNIKRPIKSLDLIKNVIVAFAKCTAELVLLEPDKLGTEVTSSKTIYFFVKKGEYKIHLETFFEHNLPKESFECVLNVFSNNEPILNSSGSFQRVFSELSNLLTPKPKHTYLSFIENSSSYDISSGHLAEI